MVPHLTINSPEIKSSQNKEKTEGKPFLKYPQIYQGHFEIKQRVSSNLLLNFLKKAPRFYIMLVQKKAWGH